MKHSADTNSPSKMPSTSLITRGNERMLFENQKWMNSREAANYLRISENSLRIKVSRGEIKPYRLGKRLRFKRSELDCMMELSK